jgi:uncharacterized membrane protein YhiD involved in acid resistance
MLNEFFNNFLTIKSVESSISMTTFMLTTICSLVLGVIVALFYMYRNRYTKSFVMTLGLLPAIVQMVIMMVNGNIGTGIAVMGAFSLVRFRSIPGSAREIVSIFFAMAVGLATGIGYIGLAMMFTLILGLVSMLYSIFKFGENRSKEKELRVTIPEDLDYTGVFDDLFKKYTKNNELMQVKTSNMGSLFKLTYYIILNNENEEKAFIDELRCRNGNLEVRCGRINATGEGL